MTSIDQRLTGFFAEYEARFNRALGETHVIDVEATAKAFTDCFIEASPNGVTCGKNNEQFRAVIPQGFEFYRNIGTKSMKIAGLGITLLDDLHAFAGVRRDLIGKA